MSPWLPKSTTAIEDRRFWQHGGVDYVGIARAAWKDVTAGQGRRGRLDDHAAARPQSLHRPGEDVHAEDQGGVPRDQAREQVAEGEDPQRVSQHRLLRQPRVRRRGRVADVLLQAREPAHAARVGAARRAAAGAVGLRPVPQPAGGARPSRRGAARAARQPRHHARPVPTGRFVRTRLGSSPAASTRASSSPTSSRT